MSNIRSEEANYMCELLPSLSNPESWAAWGGGECIIILASTKGVPMAEEHEICPVELAVVQT